MWKGLKGGRGGTFQGSKEMRRRGKMLEKSWEESWEGEGGQAPGGEEGGGEGEEGQAPEGGQKVAELPDSWVKSFFKGWWNNKDLKGLIWAWSDTSALWVFEVMLILSIMAHGHQVMLVMRTKLPWICTLDSAQGIDVKLVPDGRGEVFCIPRHNTEDDFD